MSVTSTISLSGLLIASALVGPVASLALAKPASSDGLVLVIATHPADVVTQAGGRIIGFSAAPLATLAAGEQGFVGRLQDSGAWAVLDGDWVASICGIEGVST